MVKRSKEGFFFIMKKKHGLWHIEAETTHL